MGIVDGEDSRAHAHGRPRGYRRRPAGVALAASGGGAVSDQSATAAGIPGDICADTGALLGIAGAACRNVAPAAPAAAPPRSPAARAPTAGRRERHGRSRGESGYGRERLTPESAGPSVRSSRRPWRRSRAVLGAVTGSAPVLKALPVLVPLTAVTGSFAGVPRRRGGAARPRRGQPAPHHPPAATGAGDTNVPAATQLAGLGALPGLADLPHRPVWPARPPGTGQWAAAIPYPGPRCRRPTRA